MSSTADGLAYFVSELDNNGQRIIGPDLRYLTVTEVDNCSKLVAVHLAKLKYRVDRLEKIISNSIATTNYPRICLMDRILILKEEISSLEKKYDDLQPINFPICKVAIKVTTAKIPWPEGISVFLPHLEYVDVKEFLKDEIVEQPETAESIP